MKNKVRALLLILAVCIGSTACSFPSSPNETTLTPESTAEFQITPEITPEISTPLSTPEASAPEITPPEISSEATTPENTVPETNPVATEPYIDPDLPAAENDLSAEQMAEIESVYSGKIDWIKHYFGTYGENVIFGVVNESEDYYSTGTSLLKVYYGYVNCVYSFKNGALTELAECSDIDPRTAFAIGSVAIKKTVSGLPNISNTLTEEDINSIIASDIGYIPRWYYGTYGGYAIFGDEQEVCEGYILNFDSADSVAMRLKYVDWAYAYKDGKVYHLKDLTKDITLTNEDIILINFIDCALYSDFVVNN